MFGDEQHDERGDPRRLAAPEHDTEAEDRADDVGAGVAEHEPLTEVVRQQPEGRAHHRRDRDPDGTVPSTIASGT